MSYLNLIKYVYTITNNYDLQILIHNIIKTKQLDPKKGAKFISNELCLDKLLEIK